MSSNRTAPLAAADRQPPLGRLRAWLAAHDVGPWLIPLVFLLLLPISVPRVALSDEVQYFAYLRSLYFDGDLDFRNEYVHFAEQGRRFGDEVPVGASEVEPTRPRQVPRCEMRHPVVPGRVLALVSGRGISAVGTVIVALVVQGSERARVQIGRGRHDRRAHTMPRNQGAILSAHVGSGSS